VSDSEKESLLLQQEKKGPADLILPLALGAAGAAILYTTVGKSKSSKKSEGSSASPAAANEVVFSSNFGSYSMGRDYEQLVLESYLAEQAEAGNLYTDSGDGGLFEALGGVIDDALMKNSRGEVLSAFKSTHYVKVGKERVQISALPQGKTGVQKFNEWLESRTKYFQENY